LNSISKICLKSRSNTGESPGIIRSMRVLTNYIKLKTLHSKECKKMSTERSLSTYKSAILQPSKGQAGLLAVLNDLMYWPVAGDGRWVAGRARRGLAVLEYK
jgi:hypothetical protein